MSKLIKLRDNSSYRLDHHEDSQDILIHYAHRSLEAMLSSSDELMLYSDELKELHKLSLWNIRDNQIHTGNLMGFIGLNHENENCVVRISSRFTKDDEKDFFLHYMLQKVFLGLTINLDLGTNNNENFWEFYYYLFPYYLKKALNTGLYKEYVHKKYNNINVRGAIDVKRHIQKNLPFQGCIAYNTREHSYNNRITQLIRHTIEYISRKNFGKVIFNSSMEIRENISQIEYLTHDFHYSNRQRIIQTCHEKISNPYWKDYEILRKLCLKILNQDKLSFEGSEDKVHGILFDGSWLWEEYLATILTPQGFIHPDNRNSKDSIKLAEEGLTRYPDFYCEKKIVLDAKYKRHPIEIDIKERREDTHQLLTYMYRLQSKKGILIYPSSDENIKDISYNLLGHGEIDNVPCCQVIHQCFHIATSKDYKIFCNTMKENEQEFLEKILSNK